MKDKENNSPDESEMLLKEAAVVYRTDTESFLAEDEDEGWVQFRDQCRRQMERSIDNRIKYGFCKMYKPVLDDAPWRAFKTMAEYRQWCEENLPEYLGFKRTL
ncbi:MAG: hypothetical protein ABIR24_05360 [Verrucomicrobiota bacterium]